MKTGAFVSQALIYETFSKGQINLVVADCGSGKSTAIYRTIPEKLGLSSSRVLVLIDTTAGKESFIKDGQAKDINNYDYFNIRPTIMTYAAFGAQIKQGDAFLSEYDMIVCDEIHAMVVPVRIARGKLRKQFPQSFPWEINDMLKMTCFNYIAIEKVSEVAKKGEKWVFGLTATPRNLQQIREFEGLINEVKFSQALRAYEIISSYDYTEIEGILRAALPDERKRIFFFTTVKELKKYKQVLLEAGRKAEAIWSINHNENMTQHQISTINYILEEHKLPDDVQDLLFNGAYETAITIKDDSVKEFYAHTGNTDTRTQARNRLRQDLEIGGFYNSEKAKKQQNGKKKNEKRKKVGTEGDWEPPAEFLFKPLDDKAREKLLTKINYPKKWTTYKKWLQENGYEVKESRKNNKRFSEIKK